MKDIWRDKYKEIASNPDIGSFRALTAFNANIDRSIKLRDLSWELDGEGEELDEVKDVQDVKKVLQYAVENGRNLEVDASSLKHSFSEGKQSIGGQAGIMANFLSGLEGEAIFYTPLLSEELADLIEPDVLHPYFDKEFGLKNVNEVSNTDRTKENIIIEFSEPKSGRLILSDKLRGFGPYFRSGIEENMDSLNEKIDFALLSGFQNIAGNHESKIEKSRQQLTEIEKTVHLELADCNKDLFKLIGEKLMPEADSIGLDETEALKMTELIGEDTGDTLHIGEAFDAFKKVIEDTNLERCHLHTYRYHLVVADKGYGTELDKILEGMMFGEIAAIKSASIGLIPEIDDFDGIEFDEIHVKKLDELEEFGDFFGIEDFAETGKAEIEDLKVAAIPTLIHENPVRLVGMGDLISSGALSYEFSKRP